ncbi:MAG: HAD family hydrolase [Halanaerobiales bacterium]
MENIENIIFDMDGVLVDSEPVIEAAAIKGLKDYGVEAEPEDFIPFIGKGEDRYIGGVAEKYGVPYKKEMKDRVYEIYLDIVGDKINIFPGTKEILNKLKKNYQLALASSADLIKIKANLKEANISPDIFQVIFSGDDVENKKPAPDIYLKTAEKMGVSSKNCLVIEDSLSGIKAAKSADMKCAGLTSSFSRNKLIEAGADRVIDEITEISEILPD